jgi:hypothetical protein
MLTGLVCQAAELAATSTCLFDDICCLLYLPGFIYFIFEQKLGWLHSEAKYFLIHLYFGCKIVLYPIFILFSSKVL